MCMYDLVVVGAGPVGSFLAWKFAEKGKDVLLLERGEIGEPLKCTGHISKEVFNFVPKKEKLVERKIRSGIFHNDDDEYKLGGDGAVSYVIDRMEFDKYLAARAEKAGVEIRKESFKSFRRGDDEILVNTGEGSYEAKVLAGCDGPLSDVRSQTGLPEPKMFLHGILTKVEPEEERELSKNSVQIYLDASKDFFGWKVPRKDTIEYGLATDMKNNVREVFDKFSRKQGFEIRDTYSGLIPILPPKRTASKRVFLCGDAAAQTKPFTGGGVVYGLTSALIASEVIDSDRPESIKNYEKGWRAKLGKEIWLGNWIRKFYSWPSKLRSPFLKLVENLPGESQMDRPSSIFQL